MSFSNFFEFNLNEIVTILISAFTLIFAYKIYKNFDVKKTHVNKQLETVLDLIQEINKTRIVVCFWTKIPKEILDRRSGKVPDILNNYKATLMSYEYSLFNLTMCDDKESQYDDIYFSSKVNEILPFISFVNNPLLPKEIAKKLSKFYSPIVSYKSFDDASEKYVELRSLSDENETTFQKPDFMDTYESWTNFIKCTKQLKNELENWLKKYGSEDINFNTYLQQGKI